jgi:hypothetical protein
MENCEESAIGRALDNAGYASNSKCSQEEILKANKHKEQFNETRNVGPSTPQRNSGNDGSSNAKASGAQTTKQNTGSYVVPFGKFKGQSLASIEPKELEDYSFYIVDQAEKDNKPIKGQVKDFLDRVGELLASDAPKEVV